MMRTIKMLVTCVAMIVATVGQVQAALVKVDFKFENSSTNIVASGSFQFDESLDGGVLGFGDLSSFQFSIPTPGSGTVYDLAFVNSGSFLVVYGMSFDTSTDSFQTVTAGGFPFILSAIKTDFRSGFFVRPEDNIPIVRDYVRGGEIGYRKLIVERSSLAAVPEPTSLAVFAIGACVFGVGAARRRRHK